MIKKYLAMLFAFLFPVVKRAAEAAIADEIWKWIHKHEPKACVCPAHKPVQKNRPKRNMPEPKTYAETGQFHDVLLVAFDVSGQNKRDVHRWLHAQMPKPSLSYDPRETAFLDSWWIANDDRFDGSDCDSAVFVTKGNQEQARITLRSVGLVG